ncbi:hypothetical protein J4N45_10980 [Vibrio sp. SCSIO 43140]|uniref:hypothetical protein n=1 Tax=Vibrio sp. SCSIO 43140 TaxID=2819100 RepID=UPI002075C18A|nr:hypothetical protein [Vibrio sp. SCSIO 43140]USD59054.1 hypothetical protein J4N45_10980 [Vibrio sp. SCSIO 43140]
MVNLAQELRQSLLREQHLLSTREVVIQTALSHSIDGLHDAYRRLQSQALNDLKKVITLIETGKPLYIKNKEDFRYSYAHGDCALLARGFRNLGLDLMIMQEDKEAIHFVGIIDTDSGRKFIDSYGVFSSLMPISARYINNKVDHCVVYDEDIHCEALNDQSMDFWDELEASMVETLGLDEEEVPQDLVSDYEDYAVVLIARTCLTLLIDDNS